MPNRRPGPVAAAPPRPRWIPDDTGESRRPPVGAAARHWPALLLPLVAADTLGLLGDSHAAAARRRDRRCRPGVAEGERQAHAVRLFAYGGTTASFVYLTRWRCTRPAAGGLRRRARVGAGNGNAACVVPQAIVILARRGWLLAVTGAPRRRAGIAPCFAQLRGTDGQRKTVPPLLLLPVLVLWEELLSAAALVRWSGLRAGARGLLAVAGRRWWSPGAAAAAVTAVLGPWSWQSPGWS